MPPASLFRDIVSPAKPEGQYFYRAISAGAALLIAVLTLAVAPSPVFAAEFLVGAAARLVLLKPLGEGLRHFVAALPRSRSSLLRLALSNLDMGPSRRLCTAVQCNQSTRRRADPSCRD